MMMSRSHMTYLFHILLWISIHIESKVQGLLQSNASCFVMLAQTSEVDVGGMAVEVETSWTSHQYSVTCCCHVTDADRMASDMEVHIKQRCFKEHNVCRVLCLSVKSDYTSSNAKNREKKRLCSLICRCSQCYELLQEEHTFAQLCYHPVSARWLYPCGRKS